MHKICKNCDASNSEHARFCAKCGSALHSQESSHDKVEERTPAEHGTEMTRKAKVEVNKAMEKTKHIWAGLSKNEKIIAVGAIAGLVAFILPWVSASGQSINGLKAGSSTWYVYLFPLSMLVSLAFLYFTQGATAAGKILIARWQIVIGTVWGSISLLLIIAIYAITSLLKQVMGGFGSLLGMGSFSVSVGIGIYLFAAGAIAIAVGAFRLQSELIEHGKKNNS